MSRSHAYPPLTRVQKEYYKRVGSHPELLNYLGEKTEKDEAAYLLDDMSVQFVTAAWGLFMVFVVCLAVMGYFFMPAI